MGVIRYSLVKCIGCNRCVDICPMDVFRFNQEQRKSVIAFPENCISCGQCYMWCPGHSLAMTNETYGYTVNSFRAPVKKDMNRQVFIPEKQDNL